MLPVVLNNNNFAKGAAGEPTLLSLDDARTLFHEFGHGLHGLLSDVTYERLSGTQVLRDFVELPSQLFEHWLSEREVLKRHARHWQTGEPIPDALIERLQAARRFNQGYETVRYTASALIDMAVHALGAAELPDDLVRLRGADAATAWGCRDGVGLNHRLVHFQHLFAGSGYAAGYYVYLWAEVLDADGYDAFVEAGDPFDAAGRRTAAPLRLRQRRQPRTGRRLSRLPRPRAAGRAAAAQARPAAARGRGRCAAGRRGDGAARAREVRRRAPVGAARCATSAGGSARRCTVR